MLESEGIKLEVNELPAGKYTFLSCNIGNKYYLKNGEKGYGLFKNYVASVVSDIILNKWQNILIQDIIRENYYYFNQDEKDKILEYAQQYINEKNGEVGLTAQNHRRNQIYKLLNEYLSNHDQLVVDGFIRFRLKEYISELKTAIDSAVDDFLIEREYGEFIQLLRYFVEIQEPRIEMVHVVVKKNGLFGLYDKDKERINNNNIQDFAMDLMENEINYEDLLISALISLSPRKIVFHYNEINCPKNTLTTLKDVFVERVEVCNECEWCQEFRLK